MPTGSNVAVLDPVIVGLGDVPRAENHVAFAEIGSFRPDHGCCSSGVPAASLCEHLIQDRNCPIIQQRHFVITHQGRNGVNDFRRHLLAAALEPVPYHVPLAPEDVAVNFQPPPHETQRPFLRQLEPAGFFRRKPTAAFGLGEQDVFHRLCTHHLIQV